MTSTQTKPGQAGKVTAPPTVKPAEASSDSAPVTSEAPKRTRVTTALMDYSALVPEDLPKDQVPAQNRKSILDGTPFVAFVRAANEKPGEWKSIKVKTEAVKQVIMLLTRAAGVVDCGIRLRKGEPVDGMVTVGYSTGAKRKFEPLTDEAKAERSAKMKATRARNKASKANLAGEGLNVSKGEVS